MLQLGEIISEDEIILGDWNDIPIEQEQEKEPEIDNTVTPSKEIDSIESLDQLGIPTWSSTLPDVKKQHKESDNSNNTHGRDGLKTTQIKDD